MSLPEDIACAAANCNSMSAASHDSENIYVSQLREVFDSCCDQCGTDGIDNEGLQRLCDTLQLSSEHTRTLLTLCSKHHSHTDTVTFTEFKDGFIHILTGQTGGVDGYAGAANNIAVADVIGDVSPRYIRDGKKYGRRSKPDAVTGMTRSNNEISTTHRGMLDKVDMDRNEEKKKLKLDLNCGFGDFDTYVKNQRFYKCKLKKSLERLSSMESLLSSERSTSAVSTPRFAGGCNVNRTASLSLNQSAGSGSRLKEQIESLGEDLCKSDSGMNIIKLQLRPSKSPTLQQDEEREYLRRVWSELQVGADGYISKHELSDICRYIDLNLSCSSLHTLFTKLDMDQDGLIGFDEFVDGFSMFSSDDVSLPVPADEVEVDGAQSEATNSEATSSHLLSQVRDDENKSGIFSCLDTTNSGLAAASDVVELWETQGIDEGYKVLQFVLSAGAHSDCDLGTDISDVTVRIKPTQQIDLHQLTYKLLQQLLSYSLPTTNNPLFIVAIGTFQAEISYLRGSSEQMMNERDKLKNDISDANARALMLAEEVDERQVKIEKYNAKKLRSLEMKYEDEIKALQAIAEQERDLASKDVMKLKQQLQDEIDKYEENEIKYKTKISTLEQDSIRLEKESGELNIEVERLEKQMLRQQKDLQDMSVLRDRVSELEMCEGVVTQARYSGLLQQLTDSQKENKELTDRNDELASEIERLKQQLYVFSKRRRKHRVKCQNTDGSGGGVNGDDSSGSGSSSTSNEERYTSSDGVSPIVQYRRKAVRVGKLKQQEEALKFELIKQHHDKELSDMKEKFDADCKELEEQYKQDLLRMEGKYKLKQAELERENKELVNKVDRSTHESTSASQAVKQSEWSDVWCDVRNSSDALLTGTEQGGQNHDMKEHVCSSYDYTASASDMMDTRSHRIDVGDTHCTNRTLHMSDTIHLLETENKKLKEEIATLTKSSLYVPNAREDRLGRVMHELYVENANLMSSLQISEKREMCRDTENHTLRDKCQALELLLKQKHVAP